MLKVLRHKSRVKPVMCEMFRVIIDQSENE